jgi:hypothetical protein
MAGGVLCTTWIAVKPTGSRRYTRYEVLGFGVANGAPAVRVDRTAPTITGSVLDRRSSANGVEWVLTR